MTTILEKHYQKPEDLITFALLDVAIMYFVLGFIGDSRQSPSFDFCYMDCIYVLLPRDTHMGSHHRYCCGDALLEADRAALGPNSRLKNH